MGVRVRVPATSANLGPGFDSFGLALALHNVVEAALSARWRVEVRGEGAAGLPAGADNLVARSMARVFAEAGEPGLAAEVICHNGIPVGRGLGSSSAAIVGGLMAADVLCHAGLGAGRLLEMAAEIEGHPDNVAAALEGGFTVAVRETYGLSCARIEPAGGLAAVVAVGERELPTSASREALPQSVPHAVAAGNTGRAALLALGIALGDPDYLEAGLHDALHEPYRAALVPDLTAVRDLFEASGAGPAVLSGAGPTVLGLVQRASDDAALEHARTLAQSMRPLLAPLGRGRVLALGIDRAGATVS